MVICISVPLGETNNNYQKSKIGNEFQTRVFLFPFLCQVI